MPVQMPLRMLMLGLLFIPTTLFYIGVGTSNAPGVTVASTLIILVLLSVPGRMRSTVLSSLVLAGLVLVLVLVHLLIASDFLDIDYGRALYSMLPLFLMVAGGVAMGRLIMLARDAQLDSAINLCMGVLCVASLFGAVGLRPPAPRFYAVPAFPFTEPSHMALIFTPVLMYCCATARGWKRLGLLLLGLLIATVLQSLTLVVGLVMVVAATARGYMFPVAGGLFALTASLVDITYYTSRLSLGGGAGGVDQANMSTLVYLQGWQLLQDAFPRSHGWGVGFQQFGLHDVQTTATDALQTLTGDNVNILDGGFTFAKLGGEFGVFGVAATFLLLVLAVMAFFRLRRTVGKANLPAAGRFASCVLLSYPLELFVRGMGYFSPTALLTISALSMVFLWKPGARTVPAGRALRHARPA